jgi:hypothetical protein
VILEIADLVARHCRVPDETARSLRVAFLKTTEPTFLVFAAQQPHPLFVVKVGDADTLKARSALAARLYELLPDAIARPVGVFPLDRQRALLVQNGLAGVPWFRLGERYTTSADWSALRTRAIDMLREFHAAVRTQPEWLTDARSLDAELRAMAGRLKNELAPLGDGVHTLLSSASAELAALGPLRGAWQHGDFVLNNLLIDDHRLRVIDLDDFGKWHAPFIDAFALARSVNLLAAAHVPWPALEDDLAACAAAEPDANVYTPRQKIAFFVYYILSAMIDTLQKPTRAAIRLTYRATLRDLLDDGPRYERAFEASSSGGA